MVDLDLDLDLRLLAKRYAQFWFFIKGSWTTNTNSFILLWRIFSKTIKRRHSVQKTSTHPSVDKLCWHSIENPIWPNSPPFISFFPNSPFSAIFLCQSRHNEMRDKQISLKVTRLFFKISNTKIWFKIITISGIKRS